MSAAATDLKAPLDGPWVDSSLEFESYADRYSARIELRRHSIGWWGWKVYVTIDNYHLTMGDDCWNCPSRSIAILQAATQLAVWAWQFEEHKSGNVASAAVIGGWCKLLLRLYNQ